MDEQTLNTTVASLLNEGMTLNNIQKALKSEYDHHMTFFDLRMLAADIEFNWSKLDPKAEDEPGEEEEVKEELVPIDNALVEVSKIQRPGALVSGTVTFRSGLKGDWFLDQNYQLGLQMADEDTQPSEEDMANFQGILREALQGA